MIAGLSERNVITAPRDATPGRLNRGFMIGMSAFCSRSTTPKSVKILASAPVRTQMAMM